MKDFEIKISPLTNEIYLVSGIDKTIITDDVLNLVCHYLIYNKNSIPFTDKGKLFLLKAIEQNLKPDIEV
jgi:hypothetical protein